METELVMDRRQRLVVGVALPLLIVLGGIVPWVWALGDLPDPMATHFRWDRSADGSMPVVVSALVHAAFVIPAAVVLLRAAWRPTAMSACFAVVATFVGVAITSTWTSLLVANHGRDDWRDALIGPGALLGSLGAGLGCTLPVALMVRTVLRRSSITAAGESATPLELAPGQQAAWFGGARAPGFATLGIVCAGVGLGLVVVGVVAGDAAATIAASTLLLVGGALFLISSVQVSVSASGLVVRQGRLAWPSAHFRLEEIDRAAAVELAPGEWGGWGYRGSLRIMRKAAWVLRQGPGLEVQLDAGRVFAVSVDDAEEAAAVLNGLLARARPQPSR